MFSHPQAKGIATIGGAVSGNLFTLDFEAKDHVHQPMEPVYRQWEKMGRTALKKLGMEHLFDTIPMIKTQNDGYHTRWRGHGDVNLKNEKLAKRWAVHPETSEILTDKHGKPIPDLLIESKGEGGYALCPPSPGYELIQGDLTQIPVFPIGVHDILVSIAKSFHTAIDEKSRVTSSQHESKNNSTDSDDLKPGDDYNQRGDWRSLIEAEGWELVRENGNQEYWKRPGTTHPWSATFSYEHNTLYVFSDNAHPFESEKAYSPFAIYTLIKHDGDFNAAAKDLAAQGYGSQNHSKQNGHNGKANGNGSYQHFTPDTEPGDNGAGSNRSNGTHHTQANAQPGENGNQPGPNGNSETSQSFDNAAANEAEILDLRPPVVVNNRQMRHVIADMQGVIQAYDKEPLIYQKDGRLARVKFKKERATLDYFTHDTLAFTLNEYGDFFKTRQVKDGLIYTPAIPPVYLSKAILHAPRHDVPELEFISASPLFAPDGTIATAQGYNPNVSAYLNLADDVKIADADIDPTPENVEQSKALIEKVVAEFPFDDDASKQNAISLFLLPFARLLVDAEIPLYAVDSHSPGSGKGLLGDCLMMPYLGHRPVSNSEVEGDEWRKQLTTLLAQSPDYIYFDNANQINSAALASALTKGVWQDRILGGNLLSTSEIRAIFIANGNNLEISGEIARRVCWIRLNPKTAEPENQEFTIPDLRLWVEEHRRDLIIAALTLINKWVKDGMPDGQLRVGSFERWAAVMSGIMEAVGYDQFMKNIPQLQSHVDSERGMMEAFVEEWYQTHQEKAVTIKDLFRIASVEGEEGNGGSWREAGEGILSELLTSGSKRGRLTQFGKILNKSKDKVFKVEFGEFQIQRAGMIKGTSKYRLVKITPRTDNTDDPNQTDDLGWRFNENTEVHPRSTPKSTPHKTSDNISSSDWGEHGGLFEENFENKKTENGECPHEALHFDVSSDDTKNENDSSNNENRSTISTTSTPNASVPHDDRDLSGVNMGVDIENGSPPQGEHDERSPQGEHDERSPQAQFIKNCYATFSHNPTPVEKLIRPAQAAGMDLTAGNRSPLMNLKVIIPRIAGKDIDGLTIRSIADGIYKIDGTPDSGSETASQGFGTETENDDSGERNPPIEEGTPMETEKNDSAALNDELNDLLMECSADWITTVDNAVKSGVIMRGAIEATKMWLCGDAAMATRHIERCLRAPQKEKKLTTDR